VTEFPIENDYYDEFGKLDKRQSEMIFQHFQLQKIFQFAEK
jgi:hypothetical protein